MISPVVARHFAGEPRGRPSPDPARLIVSPERGGTAFFTQLMNKLMRRPGRRDIDAPHVRITITGLYS